jgi:alpha-tubulin suppressor-like RCC1 family protein
VKIVTMGENDNGAMFVDSTGHVWSIGANIVGSQCVKRASRINTPVEVKGISKVVAVQGGGKHDLLLTSEGKVFACGSNVHGMSGLGEGVKGSSTPHQVPNLPPITEISIGGSYDAFRTADGRLYTAGSNEEGQCGVGSSAPAIWTPQQVKLEHVIQVSAGGDLGNGAMLALTASHAVYGWGNDEKGEVGDGKAERKLFHTSPVPATALAGLPTIKQVVTGGVNSFALTESGSLYGFGSNQGGALGLGTEPESFTEPQLVITGVSHVMSTAKNSEVIL